MAQALLLVIIYATIIVLDWKRMKTEGGKKQFVLYSIFIAFCFVLTMMIAFNVDLIDPQKMIVEFISSIGKS